MTKSGRRFAPEANDCDPDVAVTPTRAMRALVEDEPESSSFEDGRGRRARTLIAAPLVALAIGGTALVLTTSGAEPLQASPLAEQPAPSQLLARGASAPNRDTSRPSLKPSSAPVTSEEASVAVTPAVINQKATTAASPTSSATTSTTATSAQVVGARYALKTVNVRAAASTTSGVLDTLAAGDKVQITALVTNGFRQIRHQGGLAWVSNDFLAENRPATTSTATRTTAVTSTSTGSSGSGGAISTSGCTKSTGITSGITANARAVYQAVCAKFPAVSSFGGYRPTADAHGSGRAVDIMISGATGWEIARWLRANASRFGITELIYSQQIWTTQRAGEGWRPMSDRGSATANHYDHVHVTVR